MPPFVVAPEGTLSHGRCLLTFKTGAFVAGLPVVPILYRYKLTGHNPGECASVCVQRVCAFCMHQEAGWRCAPARTPPA